MAPDLLLLLMITPKNEKNYLDSYSIMLVNRLDHLGLHYLAYQLDRYLFPVIAT